MAEDQKRKSVLMLCAHEPTKDPRIRWEAEFAAEAFDVTVLGFNDPSGSLPAREKCGKYLTLRVEPITTAAWYYLAAFRLLMDTRVRALAYILAAPVLPLAFLVAVVVHLGFKLLRLARQFVRGLRTMITGHPAVGALRRFLIYSRSRPWAGSRVGRLAYVVTLLRVQFGPATALFWKHIRTAAQKPDVVHCNDLDTLLVGILAKKHFHCRVVYDAHEFYPFSDPEGGWIDVTFFRLLEQFLIRRADAVVTVNHLLAEQFEATYGLSNVYSVPNAEPWLDGLREPLRTRMTDLANGRVRFLFQGRYSPGRGIEELIQAWAGVDGTAAALFLRGPANLWSDGYQALAAELGLLDKTVYFLDAVTEDELVPAAAEADVGIIAYKPDVGGYKYACPNKLSQYLHAGLFVVTNDLPYVRQVLDDSKAGLCYTSDDAATLRQAVARIVADPDFLKRGRMNALDFARREFNWQHYSNRLHKLYAGTAREKSPAVRLGVAAGR